MFCTNCGHEIPDGAQFCPSCGKKIETLSSQPVAASAQENSASSQVSPLANFGKNFDISKTFLLVGAILVVMAVVTFMASSWQTVGPLGKISFLLIPDILLFSIFYFLSNRDEYADVSDTSLVLALFVSPFFVGTFLYQLDVITEVGSLLIFVSSAAALCIYLIFENYYAKRFLSYFVIFASYICLFSLFDFLKFEPIATTWLTLAYSVALLWVSLKLVQANYVSRYIYLAASSIMTTLLLFGTYSGTIDYLNKYLYVSSATNYMLGALWGVFFLGLASAFYYIYKFTDSRTFYVTKRIIEEIAVISIILSIFTAGTDNHWLLAVSIAVSLVAIFASIKVNIKSLLPAGSIGLILSIFYLSTTLFENSIGLPIAVFISGFLAIGLGFLAKKLFDESREKALKPIYGLGIDYEFKSKEQEKQNQTNDFIHRQPILAGCLGLIFFIFVIQIIFYFISRMYWL